MDRFKIPFVPPKPVAKGEKFDGNLPKYDPRRLIKQEELGRGSFGVVWKGLYGAKEVVIKEAISNDAEESKRFVKEAKLLMQLSGSEHIVRFMAVCSEPLSMLLEYVSFDFTPFGVPMKRCSSLSSFLSFVNSFKMKTVEHFVVKIAEDIVNGLLCLHDQGIVHRDLKPANILVSNQHYASMEDGDIKMQLMESCPIVCKLADFGESRSKLLQTRTMLETNTTRLQRGTFPFMAPEQFRGPSQHVPGRLEDLMLIDIWQLGMTFFCLLNPDLASPFAIEYSQISEHQMDVREMISGILNSNQKPAMSPMYSTHRALFWRNLETVYHLTTIHNPAERPRLRDVLAVLHDSSSKPDIIPLAISQCTALTEFDAELAGGGQPSWPKNDGTNACTFLCLKVAQEILSLLHDNKDPLASIVTIVEETIETYPEFINCFRDIERHYEPYEANEVMNSFSQQEFHFEFTYDLSSVFTAFSKQGIEDLQSKIQLKAAEGNFIAVYVCEPYSFLIGCIDQRIFLVDTHPTCVTSKGRHVGIIMLTDHSGIEDVKAITYCLLQRLFSSGVKIDAKQTLNSINATKK